MPVTAAHNQPLTQTIINGERFYRISGSGEMRPFFMHIVSDANHWLFVSSNGGISAGRKDTDHALFPYYTDDKITDTAEITGSKTIFRVSREDKSIVWEPFSIRSEGALAITRNLYKSAAGNKILFEEILEDWQLCFQYEWNTSNLFGFVKQSRIINFSASHYSISVLDGLQNLLPYGVGSDLQNRVSNLADAYKRAELVPEAGLGIFALSAIITDKAEPSEALKATVAWSLGLEKPLYLLSSLQLGNFRNNKPLYQEHDRKGERAAYFVMADILLAPQEKKEWMLVADVARSQTAVIELAGQLQQDAGLVGKIREDIDLGTSRLVQLLAAADALQCTADPLQDARHYSNVLFNCMRGGVFDDNYRIEKSDFIAYLHKANQSLALSLTALPDAWPDSLDLFSLTTSARQNGDPDFIRLATEYLPLYFSRRHGDPSRPWNRFSVNTQKEDGTKNLDYEGNWRDIFQNWEALATAYPCFLEGMIYKLLNASTFDGYNPYRVTKEGFDWEVIEPDNPWSYIGYWGDHQVIYLLKLLEALQNYFPGTLGNLLSQNHFVYAHVPYKIKPFTALVKDPKNTVEFDLPADKLLRERMEKTGSDGALLHSRDGRIYRVSFIEKLLVPVLVKLSNFVPGGGIWMNTQRPEWNDANNALVGNGLSMVTLYYLRRYFHFLDSLLNEQADADLSFSAELAVFFRAQMECFNKIKSLEPAGIDDVLRKEIMTELGQAGSDYRVQVYENGFANKKVTLSAGELKNYCRIVLEVLDSTIRFNKRTDQLFHAYNLVQLQEQTAAIRPLSEMLEGQVAVLSAGCLTAKDSLQLLDALRASALYRPDQRSYLLYPDKQLPGFLEKNTFSEAEARRCSLLDQLLDADNREIIEKDAKGFVHFNGKFRNAAGLKTALDQLLKSNPRLAGSNCREVLDLFEKIFRHSEFTGRSGTFYGYEGLGCIYWHMVSKLLLAVQETVLRAVNENEDPALVSQLMQHYYNIAEGIGVHKSPTLYGAFPTDPYSHTPLGKGAQQPGMTGQVKEDILSRAGELGITVKNGRLAFNPVLVRRLAFLSAAREFVFYTVQGERRQIQVPGNSLFFTCCAVPVLYRIAEKPGLTVQKTDGTVTDYPATRLTEEDSRELFRRSGLISGITVFITEQQCITLN